jgi:3-deoxy-manno-octulosonate cytidylyltransferase (CMP-KDO synthetase)
VTRVIERVRELGLVDDLVVATDAPMVAEVVERSGVRAVLTRADHPSGTDRVAEVAALPEFAGFDMIANIQGDEPFLDGEALRGAIARVRGGDDVGTAAAPLELAQAADPSRVKVVTDRAGRALWFSRAAIPFRRDGDAPTDGLYWQHVGLYVYTRAALTRWVMLPATAAEQAEKLEQLRALENGMSIGVARLGTNTLPGIDTAEDLTRAQSHWRNLRGVKR